MDKKKTTKPISNEPQKSKLTVALENLNVAIEGVKSVIGSENAKSPIPAEIVDELVELTHFSRYIFEEYAVTLSTDERKRLFGSGTKSYGFVEKSCASAADNPQFLPPYLSVEKFQNNYGDVYRKRTLYQQVKLYEQQVYESLLASSDEAYRDSLDYYNALKDATRRNIPDAKELLDELKPYFHRTKHKPEPPLDRAAGFNNDTIRED
ncbi:MAG: hypothetical protein LBS54_05985 [Dysgonamonadaceae bacterium]|jgi:hypothetical protein|nr:hypothetical protein [Dysgonamonadaceae bacterium]